MKIDGQVAIVTGGGGLGRAMGIGMAGEGARVAGLRVEVHQGGVYQERRCLIQELTHEVPVSDGDLVPGIKCLYFSSLETRRR
jgi:NAD(P)-dependent dehydrogenase (short-subunit alcohol dehydrogenase family)